MTGRDILEKKIAKKLKEHPERAADLGSKVAVVLTGDDGGRWILDCSKQPASVKKDATSKADTTITMSGESLVKITEGSLNAVSAFMFGKLKVDGDLNVAVKLGKLLS